MTDLQTFLKNLLSAPGLSGHEDPIRRLIEAEWAPLTDEISTSRLGSLHALKRGAAPDPRSSVLVAAHMDAIGLMVTAVDEGFLHVTRVGGVDPRVLPGQPVTVHGREDLPGLVVQPSPRLLPAKYSEDPVPLEFLLVDTGLPPERVARLVRPGDLVSFAQSPFETSGDTLVGHTLDNRASVAVLTSCLEDLKGRSTQWDLWAVATVQEEETLGGAITSAYQINPTIAIAVDVTFGTSPGSPAYRTFPLGGGPTLGIGANIHPAIYQAMKDLAESLDIPFTPETMPAGSGTDAMGLQIAQEGIPSMVIGIPLRYMHTPVEMVSMKDITRAGRLLAEFIARLDADFLKKLTWED